VGGWEPVSPPLQLSFVLSAPSVAALPHTAAEVAVVGRSNVGKSSLINALANRKSLAQVSNTPGRTRLLNLYQLANGGTVLDLPGYGYAAVSQRTLSTWPALIEGYLLGRAHLEMVVALIDAAMGPTRLDVQMLDWLRSHELPHVVVATKHDKVKPSQRLRRRAELAAACSLHPADIVWVSASKGTGVEQLRGFVRMWLAAAS